MTSSIDSSLAKGIRRAYLEEIEKSFEKLIKIRKQKTQRNPNINISSKKSLNKEKRVALLRTSLLFLFANSFLVIVIMNQRML